jgi:thioredoxin 1
MSANIVPVNALNFAEEVLSSATPVLIDVSTEWCPPCKAALPVVHDIAAEYAGRLKVVAIDGDASPELVAELGVRGFPTFLGFSGGQARQRAAGFAGKVALRKFAEALITADSPR